MRVVVAATAEVAIPTLEWLKESEHDLIRVITTPDSRVGRGSAHTADQTRCAGIVSLLERSAY